MNQTIGAAELERRKGRDLQIGGSTRPILTWGVTRVGGFPHWRYSYGGSSELSSSVSCRFESMGSGWVSQSELLYYNLP